MTVNYPECAKAGLDPDAVARIGRRFERLARDAHTIGIQIFCGTGSSLRFDDGGVSHLILEDFYATNVEGGDGGHSLVHRWLPAWRVIS